MKKIIFLALCIIACVSGFVKGAYDYKYNRETIISKKIMEKGKEITEDVAKDVVEGGKDIVEKMSKENEKSSKNEKIQKNKVDKKENQISKKNTLGKNIKPDKKKNIKPKLTQAEKFILEGDKYFNIARKHYEKSFQTDKNDYHKKKGIEAFQKAKEYYFKAQDMMDSKNIKLADKLRNANKWISDLSKRMHR